MSYAFCVPYLLGSGPPHGLLRDTTSKIRDTLKICRILLPFFFKGRVLCAAPLTGSFEGVSLKRTREGSTQKKRPVRETLFLSEALKNPHEKKRKETKRNEKKRKETKRNEKKRKETKRNEKKRKETKRNEKKRKETKRGANKTREGCFEGTKEVCCPPFRFFS